MILQTYLIFALIVPMCSDCIIPVCDILPSYIGKHYKCHDRPVINEQAIRL